MTSISHIVILLNSLQHVIAELVHFVFVLGQNNSLRSILVMIILLRFLQLLNAFSLLLYQRVQYLVFAPAFQYRRPKILESNVILKLLMKLSLQQLLSVLQVFQLVLLVHESKMTTEISTDVTLRES